WAWAVLAVAWSSALVLAVVLPSEPWHPPRIAATTLGLLFVTALGEAARGRRERLRMHRETLERRRRSAAEEERLRIARALRAVGGPRALGPAGVLPSETWHPPRIAATTLGLLFVTALGEAARGRRERLRMHRETLERRRRSAAEEERLRIARELHDVLAHSLSQINVQAGVGLHLAEAQPERAAEALASIKAASKSAVDEVRAVLGILRSEGEDAPRAPHPGTAELGALVAGTRLP